MGAEQQISYLRLFSFIMGSTVLIAFLSLQARVCLFTFCHSLFVLEVDALVDEFDADPEKYSRDCQVYYVRDDYAARKVSSAIREALSFLNSYYLLQFVQAYALF